MTDTTKPTIQPGVLPALCHALSALNGAVANDGARIERDRLEGAQLPDKLMTLAVELRNRYGLYDAHALLCDAADEIESHASQIEEARDTVARLVDEVRDLRAQVPRYRQEIGTREQPGEFVKVRDEDDSNG